MQTAGTAAQSNGTVRVEVLENGVLWRLVIDAPKANVLDAAKVAMLTAAFERAAQEEHLKAIVIEGEGKHFSFGASVEEHVPPQHVAMLKGFHALFRAMLRAGVPTLAVVRGQCLGGGLELASFCNRVWAAPDAMLGQPEVRLGVIAPVASAFLAERIGRAHMEDLVLT
ncbi:MAG: enoyl-CoA hydratase/isomerase family protein, partial [Planctomycetes bacterium]|nr:enoyl-CoA hydratase/isomerase family protein [Planctomycetota bacterium]